MFNPMDPPRQALLSISLLDQDRLLQNDRAVVDLLVHEVDGDTGHLDPPTKGIPHRVSSRKAGQKSRMDVENSTGISSDKPGRKNPHEAGQHNQSGFGLICRLRQRPVELLPRGKAPWEDHQGRNAGCPRPEDRMGGGIVADHHAHARAKTPLADGA